MARSQKEDARERRFSRNFLAWIAAVGLNLAMVVLLAAGWRQVAHDLSEHWQLQAATAQSWVRYAEIEAVPAEIQEAESASRGYLITGDRSFLQRKDGAVARLRGKLTRLQARLAGQPEQLARLANLDSAVEARLAAMRRTEQIRQALGGDAAARAVVGEQAGPSMNRITALADQMGVAERDRLDGGEARSARARKDANLARLTFAGLLIAVVAAIVAATCYVVMRVNVVARQRRAVFDSALDAIVVLNPQHRIEYVNKAAERMFQYAAEELAGRPIVTIIDFEPGEQERLRERLRGAADGCRRTAELRIRCKSGDILPVDVNVGDMVEPDGTHVVAVMRDCAERKRVERAKDEFVSTVSHELRTPLTSIAGSLGLLVAGAGGPLPERASRLITIAESNSRRLVRLINDILDMEKMQSGKMSLALKPVDLAELTRRSVEALSGLAAELGVRFETTAPTEPLTVQGDPDRLTQVLTNLLSNAAKFSPPGGAIDISVDARGGRARISVRDHGPGVPPEFRDRIFGKFAQADSSDTRVRGGSGLGLAITKGIVERHGGRIWFESEPGEGASFFVELPLASPLQSVARTSGPRLLLCEDDPDITQVVRAALDLQGFRVEAAPTLRAAEAALASGHFEALLLDLRLPDGDGLDLLRKLRRDPATRRLPVIVISADSKSRETGSVDLVDWIEKPIDMRRLQQVLDQAVDRHDEPPLILHIDDDPDLRQLVAVAFQGRCRLVAADSVAAAREILATVTPQLVVLDVGLPDGSGLQLIPELVDSRGRALPVVIFSAEGLEDGDLTDAVDAVLTKSRTSLSQLIRTVRRLVREDERMIDEALT